MTGVGGMRVLLANLDFAFGVRPVVWVLGAGLAVTLLAELSRRVRPGRVRMRQAAA